jgi:hypothetical protein
MKQSVRLYYNSYTIIWIEYTFITGGYTSTHAFNFFTMDVGNKSTEKFVQNWRGSNILNETFNDQLPNSSKKHSWVLHFAKFFIFIKTWFFPLKLVWLLIFNQMEKKIWENNLVLKPKKKNSLTDQIIFFGPSNFFYKQKKNLNNLHDI